MYTRFFLPNQTVVMRKERQNNIQHNKISGGTGIRGNI